MSGYDKNVRFILVFKKIHPFLKYTVVFHISPVLKSF